MTVEPFDIAWTATSRRALSQLPAKVGTAVVEPCYGPLADHTALLDKPPRFELEGLHIARRADYRARSRNHPRGSRVRLDSHRPRHPDSHRPHR